MILLFALLAQAPDAVRVEEKTSAVATIPDTIAPAVMPYARCLLSRSDDGQRVASSRPTADSVRKLFALNENIRLACAPVRTKSLSDATALLIEATKLSTSEAEAFSEAVLRNVDTMIDEPGKQF